MAPVSPVPYPRKVTIQCKKCRKLLDNESIIDHFHQTRQQLVTLLLCGWRFDTNSILQTLPVPAMQCIIDYLPPGRCYAEDSEQESSEDSEQESSENSKHKSLKCEVL